MLRRVEEIIADIRNFEPRDNWLGLDRLVSELWQFPPPPEVAEVLLAVFERYPTDHGSGVFWSIVHALETLPGYENYLVASVRRVPSLMGLTMMNRRLNGGCPAVGGESLVDLLREIGEREDALPEVRRRAGELVELQN